MSQKKNIFRQFCIIIFALSFCLTLPAMSCLSKKIERVAPSKSKGLPILVQKVGRFIPQPHLKENSGFCSIALSKIDPTAQKSDFLFFTHNDSFGGSWIFPTLYKGGEFSLMSELSLPRPAKNFDWEDICTYKKNQIVISDMGDNLHIRREQALYFITFELQHSKDSFTAFTPKQNNESDLESDYTISISKLEKIRIRYPGDAFKQKNYDCEALFCNKDSFYFLTKEAYGSRLFGLEYQNLNKKNSLKIHELSFLGLFQIEGPVTAADFQPELGLLAILTYDTLSIFQLQRDEVSGNGLFEASNFSFLGSVTNPLKKSESLMFIDSNHLVIGSENNSYAILKLAIQDFE